MRLLAFLGPIALGLALDSRAQEPGGVPLDTPDALAEAARLDLGAAVADMLLARDRSALFVLDLSAGKVLRLNPGTLAVEAEADAGDDAAALCLGPRGDSVLVATRLPAGSEKDGIPDFATLVTSYRAASLEKTGSFRIPGSPMDLDASKSGLVAVSTRGRGGGLFVVDPAHPDSAARRLSNEVGLFVHAHADGERVYAGDLHATPSEYRCILLKATPPKPGVRGEWDSPYHGEYKLGGDFIFSPSGALLLGSAGTVLRLGRTKDDDLQFAGTVPPWSCAAAGANCDSVFLANAEGVIRQVSLATLETKKTFKPAGACVHLALDPVRKILFAAVARTPLPPRPESGPRLRPILACDVVAWSLEKK